MSISPFNFREFGANSTADASNNNNASSASAASAATSLAAHKSFLPTGRKKKEEEYVAPPPPPSFSEEQLKEAERNGYQQGFLAGIEEGKKQAEDSQAKINIALSEAVTDFASHYTPLFTLYRNMLKHQAELLPNMSYAIAKKISGNALEKNSYTTIEDICLRCIKSIAHEPKITITIHESMRDTLENKIKSSLNNLRAEGEIIVIGDQNIAPPNCRIEWKNGSMLRDTEAMTQQIEQIIDEMKAISQREASQLCDAVEGIKAEKAEDSIIRGIEE